MKNFAIARPDARAVRTLAAGAALAFALVAADAAAQSRTVDERRAADPQGSVEVVNVAGRVEVIGWDRAEVQVQGTLGEDVERLEFTTAGPRTTVRVVLPKRVTGFGNDGSAELVINVPNGSSLSASLVSADLVTRNVLGEQEIQTVSGNVTAGLAREARIKTVSGDLTARGTGVAEGRYDFATVSGDADIRNVGGSVQFASVSGDGRIAAGTLRQAGLKSVSGDLALYAALVPDGRVEAESVSGDVTLEFTGKAPPGRYDLDTLSGDIDSCFGPEPARAKYGPGVRLEFTEGAGTARVQADTKSGDIRLCTR